MLTEFWEREIGLVQKAMGFRSPAKVEFDRMDLSNEESEKALLIQLADRNIVSDELLQTRFGFDPEMEKTRLNREDRDRKKDRMVGKASPYHDPEPENALKKIALQSGVASPSEVGLELDPKKEGEKSSLEMRQKPKPTKLAKDSPESLPGEPQQGRPRLSKDTEKRKERTFSPQTGASLQLWASEAQERISEIINPILLDFFGKKNLRSLSNDQLTELENIKSSILFNIKPFCTINSENITAKLDNLNCTQLTAYSVWLRQLASQLNRDLSVDDQKQAKSSFYCTLNNK